MYDVTEFVEQHPGGLDKIMLAAGSSLEPFWSVYQQHAQETVKQILEQYRIGQLAQDGARAAAVPVADAYAQEPGRLGALRIVSAKPFNAETPLVLLAASYLTPNDLFFVRNHLPVPTVDPRSYRLHISGEGVRERSYTLEELKQKFRRHSIDATLQCSGNRRSELAVVKPIKGLEWQQGAIGNARWSGVLLRDVLSDAGFDAATATATTGQNSADGHVPVRHVQFEGLDQDVTGMRYGASIPVEKVLSPAGDVLLAFEMNGQELPRDHGYPVRVVVPGHTGARSVKWLSRVVLSDKESPSHWQQKDYKSFNPSVDWDNVDWTSAPAIQESPVQSAICEPAPGATISVSKQAPSIPVRGFAFAGGGRAIQRVDVSADGGKTWQAATLVPPQQKMYQTWAWTLWSAEVALPAAPAGDAPQKVELVARAVDSACNVQPSDAASLWNLRGVMNNVWHRVTVNAVA